MFDSVVFLCDHQFQPLIVALLFFELRYSEGKKMTKMFENRKKKHHKLSLFSTRRMCSREQRKKQRDWLATNTYVITTQSHSLL
jgi:hypothetical protein